MRKLCIGFLCLLGFATQAAGDSYFPLDAWPASAADPLDQWAFLESWYGGQLAAMEEDPLWDADVPPGLTLRLLFLPTFSPASAIRLSQDDLSFRFTRLDGAGGYAPGDVSTTFTAELDPRDWDTLEALVRDADRWNTAAGPPEFGCLDGTVVVLELRRPDSYRVFERHECELGALNPLRALVLALDALSEGQMTAPEGFEPFPQN